MKITSVWLLGVVACLIAVATALSTSSNLDDAMTLRRVVFAHRHGARTPTKNLNGSCDVLGCGTLTPQGQGMLESLGRHFRNQYGYQLFGTNPETGLPKFDYDSMKVQSDESDRVVQSAGAFWNGLWGINNGTTAKGGAHVPVIKTDSTNLIDPWSQPTFALHTIPMYAACILELTKYAKNIISIKTLVQIGEEMGLKKLDCEVAPAVCIAGAADFLQAMEAEGKLSEFPIGAANLGKLTQVTTLFFQWTNGVYDNSMKKDTFFTEAGYPGATLAQNMLGDMESGLSFSEYSGHDTTLIPLYAALGNFTFRYPDFGTALVFEVYENSSSSAGDEKGEKTRYVKAVVGSPVQTPNSGWPYTFTPYALNCIDDNNQQYTTTGYCSIDDFARYLNTRLPHKGTCYGYPADLKDNLCQPTENSKLSIDPKTPCGKFRSNCPLQACGEGYYMVGNFTCMKI